MGHSPAYGQHPMMKLVSDDGVGDRFLNDVHSDIIRHQRLNQIDATFGHQHRFSRVTAGEQSFDEMLALGDESVALGGKFPILKVSICGNARVVMMADGNGGHACKYKVPARSMNCWGKADKIEAVW